MLEYKPPTAQETPRALGHEANTAQLWRQMLHDQRVKERLKELSTGNASEEQPSTRIEATITFFTIPQR